jgi:MYXO-CTERM domain-containing protein
MPQMFRPGETIEVAFRETVTHVGHFRVAFDDDGKDFPNPMTRKDTNTTLPIFIDGIDEKTAPGRDDLDHKVKITFPDKPCTNCTLQVIQVMKVNPPYNPAANADIYYQCADIVLAGDPVPPDGGAPADAGADAAVVDMGGVVDASTGAGGSGAGGAAAGGATGSGGSGAGGAGAGKGGTSGGTGGRSGKGGTSGGMGGAGEEEEEPVTAKEGCSVGGGQTAATVPVAGLLLATALFLRGRRRRR